MTPATLALVERLAREAGAPVDVSNDPNSAPSWWACGHNDVWERFWVLAMEHAAGIAQATVCDVHLPTGVKIYGTRAAAAIREAAK